MKRRSVNKRASARAFGRDTRKTNIRNIQIRRGGWRL